MRSLRTFHTASSKFRRRSIEKWSAGEGGTEAEGGTRAEEGARVGAAEGAAAARVEARAEGGAEAEKRAGLGVAGLAEEGCEEEEGEEEGRLCFSVSSPLAACTCEACLDWKEAHALACRARTASRTLS